MKAKLRKHLRGKQFMSGSNLYSPLILLITKFKDSASNKHQISVIIISRCHFLVFLFLYACIQRVSVASVEHLTDEALSASVCMILNVIKSRNGVIGKQNNYTENW